MANGMYTEKEGELFVIVVTVARIPAGTTFWLRSACFWKCYIVFLSLLKRHLLG